MLVQLQVPLQLPCYDFTPVAPCAARRGRLVGTCWRVAKKELPHGAAPSQYKKLPWCDGRCVLGRKVFTEAC